MKHIKCFECGKDFKPAVFWARYCGRKCKNRVNIREYRKRAQEKKQTKAV